MTGKCEIEIPQAPPLLSLLKKLGNVLLMGGGIAFAILPTWSTLPAAFIPFLMGHFLWMMAGKIERDRDLITLNAFMCFLDSLAIAFRFFPGFDEYIYQQILKMIGFA